MKNEIRVPRTPSNTDISSTESLENYWSTAEQNFNMQKEYLPEKIKFLEYFVCFWGKYISIYLRFSDSDIEHKANRKGGNLVIFTRKKYKCTWLSD